MDPWAIAFGLAVLAAVVAIVVARRARAEARAAAAALVDRQASVDVGTERRRSRDDLADTLDDGLLDIDATLHVRRANPAAAALLGRPVDGLVARSLIQVFLDPAAEAVAQTAIADGAAVGEVRIPDTDDGVIIVIRGTRTLSGGVTLLLSDVSELRRLQRIRTEFIDNLSHELRTPLTTVSLLAETLARDADAAGDAIPPKMRDRIGKIEVETGHLVQMVSELLDLSRIESGSSLGPLEDLDLARLAMDAAERLKLFAERKAVTIRVEVPGEPLPMVRGDPERLGQVLINLLHNAVKFSPDGGDVIVAVRGSGETVEVSVTDHGVGIPRAAQERIFERFYKVDRARVRGQASGTGLGLAIARHVIEQHHGRIWVTSREGAGSTFLFSLPT